jgi:hypothetical protein
MKVIGRTGPREYDSYLVEMKPAELATLVGQSSHRFEVAVGSTMDIEKVWAQVIEVRRAYSSRDNLIDGLERVLKAARDIPIPEFTPPIR